MQTLGELLARGKQYFDNKQYGQAESCLRRALDNKGCYADVFNMLGVISHADGRFANAIKFFNEALKLNPRYTEAILNLAVLYNDLGHYKKAKNLYTKLKGNARSSSPQIEPVLRGKLSNLHADTGDIYRSIGLYGYAIDEYKKALNLNPTYLDIRTKLGQALRENRELASSLKELKAVLRAKGTYCPALIQLGVTCYAMGNHSEAKRYWKQALSKEPDNKYARMYLRLCEAMARVKSAPSRRRRGHL